MDVAKSKSRFIPNLLYTSNIVISDLKENVFYIENSKLSLKLETIEASEIETSNYGALVFFNNSKDINITNICCYNFKSSGQGTFLYINTPNAIQALFLSLSSTTSPKSQFGIYSTSSNYTSLNISNIGPCYIPGLYNYGSTAVSSNVKYYTMANAITIHEFATESTVGNQEWNSFNAVNCSTRQIIFKDYYAVTLLKNAVFAGNWCPSGAKPIVIFFEYGSLTLNNIIIQNNGTVQGVNSGFKLQNVPNTIHMILADHLYCQKQFRDSLCSNKPNRLHNIPIVFFLA